MSLNSPGKHRGDRDDRTLSETPTEDALFGSRRTCFQQSWRPSLLSCTRVDDTLSSSSTYFRNITLSTLRMKPCEKNKPRIIIHGGAGNITRSNLTKDAYQAYRSALLSILHASNALLSKPGATALDVATHAVSMLEDNPLFNSGHGAVYTTAGTHELEASVMVSKGCHKRGVGVMEVSGAKNPIKLARELLIRGEDIDGGGAAGHVQLAGETANKLAEEWGLETVSPGYYWTKRRWDEHRKALGKSTDRETYLKHKRRADKCMSFVEESAADARDIDTHDPSWDGSEYLPQGTVGAVVLDSDGMLCVATSTGGLTNKLPGRIGDTPTLGAGFWAEQWTDQQSNYHPQAMVCQQQTLSPATRLANGDFGGFLQDCLPTFSSYLPIASQEDSSSNQSSKFIPSPHGVALSGTGNGDSFLKTAAARTACAMTRFSSPPLPFAVSVSRVAGPNGILQQSAEDRWKKTGEGEGGVIGIEHVQGEGIVVADFNCGGMFRAWVDDDGEEQMMVFKEGF
ncbi:N-terminal nucleophile aminohydrolase [Aureobasidium subglaciale]|nr:N-terminal nucleophile aminohydrolase [Aureobasidium subglaciale]KAI5219482.1 N-terminal nucleophile aminohydrolase [Aureobasidium subglaciale]KAI5223223.1 N-terminal nucleophile aminohydrolase [Aureobasidium subglaciale]KAI5259772.1 N-terminal nucleophile aminohydrolase [Aureobasidium subglaciale]